MRQLNGNDAFMLYLERPEARNNLCGIQIYDPSTSPKGEVTFEDVLETFEQRLHMARVFREKLVRVPFDLDHPWWVDDEHFDLEYHVREIALPKPGNWRQLWTQATRIHSRPFDFTRPPWEIYMIQGLDHVRDVPEGCFAVLMRLHHTAVDGLAGIEIMNTTHDRSPDADPPVALESGWRGEPEPSASWLLARAAANAVRKPVRVLRGAWRTVPVVGHVVPKVLHHEIELPALGIPRTRFNEPVTSAQRVFEGRRFELADLKTIKGAVPGATINDVGLAVVSGALRRYLDAHGELPEASLGAAVPISIRAKGEHTTAGNEVGSMIVSLCTDVADPLERLACIHHSTAASKVRKEAIGARTLTQFSDELPGRLLGVALRAPFQLSRVLSGLPAMPFPVTNVPGPPTALYFAGAEMVAMYGLGPVLEGMGMINTITSYNGSVFFNMTAAKEMMPDPELYGDCLDTSFKELHAAVS